MSAGSVKSARPGELLEFTSARGIAAVAVLIYHVDAYCGGVLGRYAPTEYLGPLAVDFFFALSGFVLTHVYREGCKAGSYRHDVFLLRRFARVWPLHMACLLGVGAIVLVGSHAGLQPQWKPTVSSFLTHASMLHATGLSPEKSWNQPSWSVSAEWTAYLLFPLYLSAAGLFRSALGKLALAAVMLVAFVYGIKTVLGLDLFELTTLGALRIVPMFFAGVVLREVMTHGHGLTLSARSLDRLLIAAIVVLYTGMSMGAPMAALWVGLLVILYLLALRSFRPETSILRTRPMVWLGDVSYALYLVHAAVLMIVYGLGAKVLHVSSEAGLIGLGAFAAGVALLVAALGYTLVERPAQRLILRLAGQVRAPVPAAVAATH
jgi:peptidoglycan/LPS O-acetylase OafA/YrhL